MSRLRFYTCLAALALLAASCSHDDDATLRQGAIGRIALYSSASGETTSTIDGRYKTLTVYAYKGTEVDNSVEFHYEEEKWKQYKTLKVPIPANDASFIGMTGTGNVTQSPFRFEFSENAKSQDSDDGLFAADFMTTDRTPLGKGDSISLDFKHRMAKVTVKITEYGTELGTNTTISNVSFKSAPAIMLNYDSETGEATVTSIPGSDLDITPAKTQDEGCYSYTAIIATKAAGEQLMALTANNTTFTVNTNTALESGNHYTFNLKVGKDLVLLSQVSITSWENTNPQTGITTNVALPEATGTGVGVFVRYNDNDPDNADNLKLSANNMIEHVWKSYDATPHIMIYSPYSENATYDNIPLTHGTDHCCATINNDKSQTVSELIGSNKTLSIAQGAYHHVMGKLTLKFQDSKGNTITPSDVRIKNFYKNGILRADETISYSGLRTNEMKITDYSGLLVIPQTLLEQVETVTASYNDKTYTYYPNTDFTIGKGEHVTLTLTIPSSTSTQSASKARSTSNTPQRMKGTISHE